MARKPYTVTLEVTEAEYGAFYVALTEWEENRKLHHAARRTATRAKQKLIKAYREAVEKRNESNNE